MNSSGRMQLQGGRQTAEKAVIHGVNNRVMLDEIRELATKIAAKQTNSEDVLLWAR